MFILIINLLKRHREKSDLWCQDTYRWPSKISAGKICCVFCYVLVISVVERLLISFSLIVFQFLTEIIYWLEILAVQDQNWHWIQHKDIFTNHIKRRLDILANHKNSLCSLHLLVATLKPLLKFRLGIHLCYTECKVWSMTISKKGKPYCFQPILEQDCGGILYVLIFILWRKQTDESIQLLVWGFFPQCWGTSV